MSRSTRFAIASAVTVNLAGVLPLFLTGAMAVQISNDFGVGPREIGLMIAAFAAMSFVGSAPLGRQVGRLGISRSLIAAAIISGLALLGSALAPDGLWLAAALGLAGIGNAIGQTSSNALVAARVPANRFGIAYAIKQSAIPVSIILGGLAVPAIALTLHWRAAYIAALFVAVVAALMVPHGVRPPKGRSERSVPRSDLPGTWLLGLGVGLIAIAAVSIGAHAASSAVSIGFSEATAGFLVSLGGLIGLAVRLSVGYRADRVSGGALAFAAILAAIGAVGWLLMATQSAIPFLIGLLLANGFGWGWPGLVHLAVARRFPNSTAAASGITQTGVSLGLLVGPPMVGALAVSSGWGLAWSVAAICAFLGAIVMMLARALLRPGPHAVATGQ